jgi:hypothetical protein
MTQEDEQTIQHPLGVYNRALPPGRGRHSPWQALSHLRSACRRGRWLQHKGAWLRTQPPRRFLALKYRQERRARRRRATLHNGALQALR